MNKSKEKILIKKERLIVSYLWIIFSIFGIFFYSFIIVDGFGFLVSIFSLILGLSLTILLLKGKLCFAKKWEDKNIYLIFSILYNMLGVLNFLTFVVNPYKNAIKLIFSLPWLAIGVFYMLLHLKFFKMKIKNPLS